MVAGGCDWERCCRLVRSIAALLRMRNRWAGDVEGVVEQGVSEETLEK